MPLLGEATPWAYGLPAALAIPVMLLVFFLNALPEESSWRAYALDRLQQRWSALGSSLILGLIWSIWHLPLHFIAGTTQQAIPVW